MCLCLSLSLSLSLSVSLLPGLLGDCLTIACFHQESDLNYELLILNSLLHLKLSLSVIFSTLRKSWWGGGAALWSNRLSCHLRRQYPIGTLFGVPIAPTQIQLPVNVPGRAAKDGLIAWAAVPTWKTQMEFQALAWSSPGHHGPLRSKLMIGRATKFRKH